MERMLKKSRFVHVLENPGILWHSLLKKRLGLVPNLTSYFSSSKSLLASEWKKLLGHEFDVLEKQGFLVEEKYDEALLEEIINVHLNQQIQGLYLLITTACNLDCSYCLYRANASQSLSQVRHMEAGVMERGLRMFTEETNRNDRQKEGYWEQVTLYGGEPLLNRKCVEAAFCNFKKMKAEGTLWKDACLVVNTNGTLIDAGFAELAARYEVEIQISIDGPREIHDQKRKTRHGDGTFLMVLEGMKNLQKTRANLVPMITLNSSNIEEFPEFIGWLCRSFGIKRYAVNLLMSTTEKDDHEYPNKAAHAMLEADRIASQFGAGDEGFKGVISSFFLSQVAKQSCGAGRKITIFPDGKIHSCQALEKSGLTEVGLLPQINRNCANWKMWKARTRFLIDECLDCPVLGSCGGGCAAGSYHSEGSISAIDPNYCRWIKSLFWHKMQD